MKNVIWLSNIGAIGGVESVIYNVIRKYKDRDITIWYKQGDIQQLKRMSNYANLLKFSENQHIECDRLIINYDYPSIKGHFKANKVIYLVHANYEYLINNKIDNIKPINDDGIDYYAVSQYAANSYYKISGVMPKICYNPVLIDDDRKALLIVSATRLYKDKGKLVERMETLANRLDERNVPFVWLVFTSTSVKVNNKSVINVPSRLDILPFLRKADFVAQLSDTEAFCMTALESATMGTPLLITEIPSFKEMKLNSENAIYFNFDMSNIDDCIDQMIHKKYDFTYKPNDDLWGDLLVEGQRKEELKPLMLIKVKATKLSQDRGIHISELGRIAKPNEIFEVEEERLNKLLNNQYGAFVEVIPQVHIDEDCKKEVDAIPDDVVLPIEDLPKETKPKKATKKTK